MRHSQGVAVRVRRPTDYNPALAATLGPSQPSPHLNLGAVGLTLGGGYVNDFLGSKCVGQSFKLANFSRYCMAVESLEPRDLNVYLSVEYHITSQKCRYENCSSPLGNDYRYKMHFNDFLLYSFSWKFVFRAK